jgi:hypothetical protein
MQSHGTAPHAFDQITGSAFGMRSIAASWPPAPHRATSGGCDSPDEMKALSTGRLHETQPPDMVAQPNNGNNSR